MAQTEQSDVDDIRFFSSNRWVNDLSTAAKGNEWIAKLRHFVPVKYTALKHYHRMRSRHLTKLTEGMNDRVFHSPNFILMPFDGPSVATFHDLSFVHYRETQPAYRLKFLDREIPKTLDQANHIVTPSEHVRQEIIKHFNYFISLQFCLSIIHQRVVRTIFPIFSSINKPITYRVLMNVNN